MNWVFQQEKKIPNGEWEDNSGIIFPRYFKTRNSILCTEKDKNLTEKYLTFVNYFMEIGRAHV